MLCELTQPSFLRTDQYQKKKMGDHTIFRRYNFSLIKTRRVPTVHVQCASQDIPRFCIGMTYDEVRYPSQPESDTQFRRLQ